MSIENLKNDSSEKSAVQLLQEINSGRIDPKLLDPQSRQRCIEVLVAEGYTIPNIAQVLKRNEKTIRRDLKEIQAQHSLSPSVEFAKEFIGQVLQKALNHHAYLMRIARSKDATPGERSQSEFAAWKVLKELVEKLQTTGHLPVVPTAITGNFHLHSQEEEMAPEEMRKTLADLEEGAKEAGILDEEVLKKIANFKRRIEQSELAGEIKQLEQNTSRKESDHESES